MCSSFKGCNVEISCDEFYESYHARNEVQVTVGDIITIDLCTNPTTGFQWREAQNSNQDVLGETGRQIIGPENVPPPPPGTPSKGIWTFKALGKGISTITMEYSRPWESGEKGEWTYTITAAVK